MSAWDRRTHGTPGYNVIMGEIRMGDFDDPWGTAMAWLFALAEVLYVEGDEIMPDFRPAPSIKDREDLEGWETEAILYHLDSGACDFDDLREAFTIMSRFGQWCRIAGRDY